MGLIGAPHGIRGEVSVQVLTDFPQRFSPGSALYVENPGADAVALRIEKSHRHRQFWIIKLEGIETREDAEALRGRKLLIPEQALQSLPPNHYYMFQLIGCQVVDTSGQRLGTVTRVLEAGGGALLQVEGLKGETLIPMVEGIVLELDVGLRLIRVDLPVGLIGLNS